MPNGSARTPCRSNPRSAVQASCTEARALGAVDVGSTSAGASPPAPGSRRAVELLACPERRVDQRAQVRVEQHLEAGAARLCRQFAAPVAALVARGNGRSSRTWPGPAGTTSAAPAARAEHARNSRSARSSSGTCSSRLAETTPSTPRPRTREVADIGEVQLGVGHQSRARVAQPGGDEVDAGQPGARAGRAGPRAGSRSSNPVGDVRAGRHRVGRGASSSARRVHTSMKWSRLDSSCSASRSSDQLTSRLSASATTRLARRDGGRHP